MTQKVNATPVRPNTGKTPLIQSVLQILSALGACVIAGLPAALTTFSISNTSSALARSLDTTTEATYLFDVGLSAGLAFIFLVAIPSSVIALWSRISRPSLLRAMALITIQFVSIGIGLLLPPAVNGAPITWALAGIGSVGWWSWQIKWRGTGIAPSLLAGVLRPHIHPGQIWFAVVVGRKETKIRPVMVLNPDTTEPHRWVIAYFTTQPPKNDYIDDHYLQIPAGALRGLAADNWIALNDPRTLNRPNFRTYTGLAPTWLYEAVSNAHGMTPNPLAWTIDEMVAGEGLSPMQKSLMRSLGLRHGDNPNFEDTSWETAAEILKLPISLRWRRRR